MRFRKITIVLAVLLLISGIGFIAWNKFKSPVIIVPDFKGESEKEVLAWKDENNISTDKVIFAYSYDEEVPEGQVISQNPTAGSTLNRNQILTIRMSKGEDPVRKVVLEDFTGMTRQQIADWFKENDISHYKFIEEIQNDKEEGTFLRSDPTARQRITEETEVKVYISVKEDEEDQVALPNFTGWGRYDIETWGYQNGIIFTFDTEYSDITYGYFTRADVAEGTMIDIGSSVHVFLSQGPYTENTYYEQPAYTEPEYVVPVEPEQPSEPEPEPVPDQPVEPVEQEQQNNEQPQESE